MYGLMKMKLDLFCIVAGFAFSEISLRLFCILIFDLNCLLSITFSNIVFISVERYLCFLRCLHRHLITQPCAPLSKTSLDANCLGNWALIKLRNHILR